MVVYVSLLALARATTGMRLLCEAVLVFCYIHVVDGWYCGAFLTGMLISDLHILGAAGELPAVVARLQPRQSWVYYALLLASLYLGGVPSMSNEIERLRKIPGWYLLSFLTPQAFFDFRWHFRYLAATFAILSIPHIPWLKSFLERSYSQYLGRISYSVYLVHGPILWTVGDRIYAAVERVTLGQLTSVPHWINKLAFPDRGPVGLELNYLIPHLILFPLTLVVSELVTKGVDEPCIRFAWWVFVRTSYTRWCC